MTGRAVPEEVFLVFRPRAASEGLRWWQRLFTDRHRAHVVALLPPGPDRALALDHAGSALGVELVELPAEQAVRLHRTSRFQRIERRVTRCYMHRKLPWGTMYTTHLRKVGGSVMLAVPPALLDVLRLKVGAKVGLAVDNGRLVVEPRARPRYTLDELLAQCDGLAGIMAEDREWLAAKPVGGELL